MFSLLIDSSAASLPTPLHLGAFPSADASLLFLKYFGNKKALRLPLPTATETKDKLSYAVPLSFRESLHALNGYGSIILYPSLCNGRDPSVSTLLLYYTEDFGQPLQGEFQSFPPLPRTRRQLSVFGFECTIPHQRIYLFH